MSKAPSMPMYWDAYLADTTHLTTEEHGAYMLLLAAMWRRNGWVPDDDRDNARILGLTVGKWRKIKARLSDFLMFSEEGISQKKLLETWENTQEKIEKNRANGAKGGRPASNKNKDLAKANGSNSVNPIKSIPEPEPEPVKKKPTVSKKTNGSRLSQDFEMPPEWIKWATGHGKGEGEVSLSTANNEAAKFKDWWLAKAGKDAVKVDWFATWRGWIRRAKDRNPGLRVHKPTHGEGLALPFKVVR